MRNRIAFRHGIAMLSALISMAVLGISTAAPLATEIPTDGAAPCADCVKGKQGRAEAGRAEFERRLQSQYLADDGTNIDLGEFPDDDFHRQLIQELLLFGRSSKERSQYFTWLDKYPDVRCNGWRGTLLEAKPSPEGLKVRVAVTPTITLPRDGGLSVTTLLETYLRTDDGWVYQTTERVGPPAGCIIFN